MSINGGLQLVNLLGSRLQLADLLTSLGLDWGVLFIMGLDLN